MSSSDAKIVSVVGGPSGYAQDIRAGAHRIQSDEPVSLGGTDSGPSPYALLLASLGSCTSMTIRMYADRKGWPLEGVRVELSHDKIYAEDCEECEATSGKVDKIVRRIHVEGPLDDDQKARLLQIADKCPVHKTLKSEITIQSELA